MEINKQKLLRALEYVTPGLAAKEIIEQTKCFVFREGRLCTFNDEIACSIPLDIGITGAVQSDALLSILSKINQDTIHVSVEEGQLILKTKSSRTGLILEEKILLSDDVVEKPKKWVKLHESFIEAVELVQDCASPDESRFDLACVHIASNFIEACDLFQMARYDLPTGLKRSVLIRATAFRSIVRLGMTHFSESQSWLHFKNADGLVLSVRLYVEDYPDLTEFFNVEGEELTFPGGLAECVEKAEVFSSANKDTNTIMVALKFGKIRVKGSGVYGWHEEVRKTQYNGPAMTFTVAPKLFIDFTQKARECTVNQTRLLVDGGSYKWLGCLEASGE